MTTDNQRVEEIREQMADIRRRGASEVFTNEDEECAVYGANINYLLAEVERLTAARRIPELDNHHNAILCPYCSDPIKDEIARITALLAEKDAELKELHRFCGDYRRQARDEKHRLEVATLTARLAELQEEVDSHKPRCSRGAIIGENYG